MRLDQQAAVSAYRVAEQESFRLGVAGGASKPSTVLKSVAMGDYLDFVMDGLRGAKEGKLRLKGSGNVVYAAALGWHATVIHVKACEDVTRVLVVDEGGENRTPSGHRRYVQDYSLAKTKEGWKVSAVESLAVASFETYGCDL